MSKIEIFHKKAELPIQQSNDEMEEAKLNDKPYIPFRYSNGDTRKELLIRSRYLLFKSANNQTEQQKERASILFEEYPDIKKAYGYVILFV